MKEGVDMYCDNCHRQSPDNFVNCPYCSAPLKNNKRKKPQKFVKKKERKKPISFKTFVIGVVIVAALLAVSAVVTGALTGSKPDSVVKKMVTAIQANDAELYYSLYDDQIIEYYKENFYYGDEETFDAVTKSLEKSVAFYTSKCGEDFDLKYKINDVTYLEKAMLDFHKNTLSISHNYKKLPDKVAVITFEIEAKGSEGTYKSVYDNFWCARIGGKWYIHASATEIDEDAVLTEQE